MSTGHTPESGSAGRPPSSAWQPAATTLATDQPVDSETGPGPEELAPAQHLTPGISPRGTEEQRIQDDIPWGVRIAAAWSWRAIIILIAAGVAIWLLGYLVLILVPLMVAGLLTTLLRPLHNMFVTLRLPRILSAMASIVVLLAVVLGILYLVGNEIVQGFAEMADQVMAGIYDLIEWADQTAQQFGLEISAEEFNQAIDEVVSWIQQNQDTIMSSAGAFGSAATNITVGTILVLFTLIFFLADGRKIWDFLVNFTPSKHRPAIHGAGRRGWTAVGTYMRVQVFVAFVDALGIGIGAWILDVPLALPIAVLVFFGGFIPIVGAVATGAVAVLLAWVAHDFLTALMMLGVVLLVQQVESNVLQPIVMGRAVKLHPLAVVLAVTAGTTLLGIAGALFAVPVLAFINRASRYLTKEEWRGDDEALEMEHALREQTLKRAAQKEQYEAEDEASIASLKHRIFETIPGLDPNKPPFARHQQDEAGRRAGEESQEPDPDEPVPAPKPAAHVENDDKKRDH